MDFGAAIATLANPTARNDENVFKITTRSKNENTDHRVTVTASLIPLSESRSVSPPIPGNKNGLIIK